MLDSHTTLAGFDPEIARSIDAEQRRQEEHVELIASENYVSRNVLEAQGSVLTNKYAEGYPGKRYYGGCEFVDVVETLAIERAKAVFGAEHANVQPHSGSQANMSAYFAFLKPGDKIMGLSLSHGGHLTHGHPVNFSGMFFDVVAYEVDRAAVGQVSAVAEVHAQVGFAGLQADEVNPHVGLGTRVRLHVGDLGPE